MKMINLKLQTFAIFLCLRKDSLNKKPRRKTGLSDKACPEGILGDR